MKRFILSTVCMMMLSIYAPKTYAANNDFQSSSKNSDLVTDAYAKDSVPSDADYAVFHIYRPSGAGALVSYDLHLGDTVLCRVTNKCKITVKVTKDGLNTIWAKTEVKKEIPVNVKFGNEYYIRCSITMGAFVGHPKIELVDNKTGEAEFNSKKLKVNEEKLESAEDKLYLKDGRVVDCHINDEDSVNVYFTIFRNDKPIKTQCSKDKIDHIDHGQ